MISFIFQKKMNLETLHLKKVTIVVKQKMNMIAI